MVDASPAGSGEKTVYLVRHGESEHNIASVFQAPDCALSPAGIRQAERVAGRLSRLPFDALIASPFPRARATAEIIARAAARPAPELSELFVERLKPSSINGRPFTDAGASAIWSAWEQSLYTPGMRVQDGEAFEDLMTRADTALAYLGARRESSLVVVTHGYFLRTLLARVLLGPMLTGEIFQHFQRGADTENTGVSVLRWRATFREPPRWRLWTFNDHAHLAAGPPRQAR